MCCGTQRIYGGIFFSRIEEYNDNTAETDYDICLNTYV